MSGTGNEPAPGAPALSAGDVLHLVGAVTDDTLLAILKCEPTMEQLEVAASYLSGEGSKVDRAGHPMTGKIAEIYDILRADALYEENDE